jgi:hypothetical protein
MAFEGFDKANEKGYDKFTHMAVHFKEMITDWIRELPEHTIVYFLHHTEIGDDQRIKPKTLGKMLDSQLVVEGLFSIVLLTWSEAGNHFFVTNSDGSSCAKTPMGMFDAEERRLLLNRLLMHYDFMIRNMRAHLYRDIRKGKIRPVK